MAVVDVLKNISDRVSGIASVNTVFGEPRVLNNRAIIPVGLVTGGFGAGGGEGKQPAGEQGMEEGSGVGGGGGFSVRPLAVLEVTDEQTRLIPILDMTKIIMAGFGIVAGIIFMKAKSNRR